MSTKQKREKLSKEIAELKKNVGWDFETKAHQERMQTIRTKQDELWKL